MIESNIITNVPREHGPICDSMPSESRAIGARAVKREDPAARSRCRSQHQRGASATWLAAADRQGAAAGQARYCRSTTNVSVFLTVIFHPNPIPVGAFRSRVSANEFRGTISTSQEMPGFSPVRRLEICQRPTNWLATLSTPSKAAHDGQSLNPTTSNCGPGFAKL